MSHFSRKHIISAGAWTLGGSAAAQLIRLVSNLVMTRLLVPEMFALMAIASVIFIGVAMISDVGLNQKIVQSADGENEAFLNTVWTVQIIRGVFIWLLAVVACIGLYVAGTYEILPINTVYADPDLPFVLSVVCFSAVISGFQSTRVATLMRDLDRRRLVLMELFSQLVGLGVMFTWAVLDRSVWALVVGGLASTLSSVLISHRCLPGKRNRLDWDEKAYKEIFHFGKWIFVSSGVGFLVSNGDRLLLAGLLSPRQLGIYVIAFFIMSAIMGVLNKVLGSIVFPVFSKVANTDHERLKDTYYRVRLPLDFSLFFLVGILYESGSDLINVLYDKRYAEAGPMLEILSLCLISTRYKVIEQYYLAKGQVKTLAGVNSLRALALFILVPVFFQWFDINGVLWAIVFSYFAAVPYAIYYKYRNGLWSLWRELVPVPAFFVGVIVVYWGAAFLDMLWSR